MMNTTWRKRYLTLAGALTLAILVRLATAAKLPIFYDESVYVQRAQVFPNLLGRTLTDGKLLQELMLAALAWLPGDPLIWGRGFSLLIGLGVVVALGSLGHMLGRPWAGRLAGLLYAVSPLASLHDGLALPDSLLSLVGCGILATTIRLVQKPDPGRRDAVLVGGMIGVAVLVKLPGLFLACFPILAVMLMSAGAERHTRAALLRTTLIAALLVPALLAPFHYGGAESQKLGGDWLIPRVANSMNVADWVWRYLPGALLLLPVAVLLMMRAERTPIWRTIAWLLAGSVCFCVTFVVLGSTLYPRYFLAAWPALLLAVGLAAGELWGITRRWREVVRWVVGLVLGGAILWGIVFSAMLAREPVQAPMVAMDRWQYLESWTAGYQADALLGALRHEVALHGAITVVVGSEPRLVGNLARIYLGEDPRVRIMLADLPDPSVDQQIMGYAVASATYLLVDQQQLDGYRLAERFPKAQVLANLKNPNSPMRFYIYQIQP